MRLAPLYTQIAHDFHAHRLADNVTGTPTCDATDAATTSATIQSKGFGRKKHVLKCE